MSEARTISVSGNGSPGKAQPSSPLWATITERIHHFDSRQKKIQKVADSTKVLLRAAR
jgi:hypothetical protein